MSYRRSLGAAPINPGALTLAPEVQAQAQEQQARASGTAAQEALNIVPDACRQTWATGSAIRMAPSNIPAGTISVWSYMSVQWTGSDKTQALLSALVPGVPPVSLAGLFGYPLTPTLSPVMLDWLLKYTWADLSFFGAGFVPDPQGVENQKGTLWLAVRFKEAVASSRVAGALGALARAAGQSVGATINPVAGGVVADSTNDRDLVNAAYQSAQSAAIFSSVLLAGFVLAPGITGGAVEALVRPIIQAATGADQVYAFAAGGGKERAQEQVSQITGQARSAKDAVALALAAQVREVRSALQTVQRLIGEAPGKAQRVLSMIPLAYTELPARIRDGALANASRYITGAGNVIARDYIKCSVLGMAQTAAAAKRTEMQQQLGVAQGPAQWILANPAALQSASADIETMLAKLAQAEADLDLPWYQRHLGPLPIWGWGVAAAGTLLVGAVGVRALRHRKPTPNRRRHSRRLAA